MTIRSARRFGFGLIAMTLGVGLAVTAASVARADELSDKWVGKPAPAVKIRQRDGKMFDSTKVKGKVVVLDIWATWCPPCRESLPHIQTMSADKDLAAKGLMVVAVNHGEKRPTVDAFLKKNNYTFNVAMDMEKSLGRVLGVTGIPTTIVIGRDGNVANVFVGFGQGSAERLDKAVEEALAVEAPTTAPAESE